MQPCLVSCTAGLRLRLLFKDGWRRGCAESAGSPAEGVHADRRAAVQRVHQFTDRSIMLWGHYAAVNHPCWQLFKQNASAFNEEAGEIALSVLARDIARGGVRGDLKKVSQTFSLVKAKSELPQEFGIDMRATISVRAIAHVVSPTIRQMSKPRRLSSRL